MSLYTCTNKICRVTTYEGRLVTGVPFYNCPACISKGEKITKKEN